MSHRPNDLHRLNRAIVVALELGYLPYGANKTARRHWYWFLPDSEDSKSTDFSVHWHKGASSLIYHVGQTEIRTTERAIKLLRKVVKRESTKGAE